MDAPERLRNKLDPYDLSALQDTVNAWPDRQNPTDSEQARLLDCAFLKLRELVKQGACERVMKSRQIHWLAQNVPALARNEAALRRSYNRWLKRWRDDGGKITSVFDARASANKARRAPKLPKQDFDLLVSCAVQAHEGRVLPAWVECWSSLTQETRDRYPFNRFKVPNTIRDMVGPEAKRLLPVHISPRQARLNGAYIRRDWSKVFAGDVFSSDDCTLPVYFYNPDEPSRLLRGQFLPMIDVRSQRILEFAFEAAESYTAVTIRALVTRVCSRFGLPRFGFHFECGIWKKAKLLGGKSPNSDGLETFAERLGLHIQHSNPGNARSKIVERDLGVFQRMLVREFGYVGNDERSTRSDRVASAMRDVEAGRRHPREAGFHCVDEWMQVLSAYADEYNDFIRDSRAMGGVMSPNQAWELHQERNTAGEIVPLVAIPSDLRYLLAEHKQNVVVSRNGISLFGGKYSYKSADTGRLQGQAVTVWFDPERPDLVTVTDLNGDLLCVVPRCPDVHAYCGFRDYPDESRLAAALTNEHNRWPRRRYSELKAAWQPPKRAVIVDPKTRETAQQIANAKEAARQDRSLTPRGAMEADMAARSADFDRRVEETMKFIENNPQDFTP